MQILAKISEVLPAEEGTSNSGNAWTKTVFVVETDGQYPKKIAFELFNKKEIVDTLRVGQPATVHFDVESREYNGRYYTACRAWKVEAAGAAQQQSVPTSPSPSGADDDFPF
jgi:hypothetical protein